MPEKTILIAGASGHVGYAALKHFTRHPRRQAIALSRRNPGKTFGARYIPLDRRTAIGPPAIVSAMQISQAGCHDTMDTEVMFGKWFRVSRRMRLLPLPDHPIA